MARPIAAGDFRFRVNVETRAVSTDDRNGAEVETWTPAASDEWAKIVESSTARAGLVDEAAVVYARPTRIWLHYRSNFDHLNHRVRYGSQVYRILGVAETEQRRFLELSCAGWSHD